MGVGSDHRVWVASDDGLQVSVWDGSSWTSFGLDAGWKPLPVPVNAMKIRGKVATDALGQVWLATERDVRMFDGAGWKVLTSLIWECLTRGPKMCCPKLPSASWKPAATFGP